MLTEQEQKAYNRYQQIKEILEEHKDKVGLKLLKELIDKVTGYVSHVVGMAKRIETARFRLDQERYIQLATNLDEVRGIKHNALISQLKILNRYLFKTYTAEIIPFGGVYSLDPETINMREVVGDWAGYRATAIVKKKS